MIDFLNRYQRAVTIAITVCVVTTFVFFGVSKAFIDPSSSHQEQIIWTTKTRKLSAKQFSQRSEFLACENADFTNKRELLMSWLNPGFVSEWFLQTGIGKWILEQDTESLQYLKKQYQKERNWSGYKHPNMKQLNFQSMLDQFNPDLSSSLVKWKRLKKDNQLIEDKLELWLKAKAMPFHIFRDLIRYQESTQPQDLQDPSLNSRSMQLFGYNTLQGWFGKNFLSLCTQLVGYGAEAAESLGYQVSSEQIEMSLKSQLTPIWQGLIKHQPELTFEELKIHAIESCGMPRDDFYSFWRDLLLFDKFFRHEGSQVWLDSLSANQFSKWVAQEAELEIYQVPKDYQVANFQNLYHLQMYLQAISGIDLQSTNVPKKILETHQIALKAPELLSKRVRLEVRALNLDDCKQLMSPKDLFALEASDAVWKVLIHQLPAFALKAKNNSATKSKRLQLLSELTDLDRELIDKIAVRWLVENEPQKVQNQLMAKEPMTKDFSFILASLSQPLEGISNAKEFLDHLEKDTKDNLYTQDGMHYYHVKRLSDVIDEVLSLSEAKKSGVLEAYSLKKLKNHYEVMKSKPSSAVFSQGKLLDFAQVLELVALDFFQPLLVDLQRLHSPRSSAKAEFVILKDAHEVAGYRYNAFLEEQHLALKENRFEISSAPWALECTHEKKKLDSCARTPLAAAFKLKPGEWLQLMDKNSSSQLVRLIKIESLNQSTYQVAQPVQAVMADLADEISLLQWIKTLSLDWKIEKNQKVDR
jgi:hypothetical protein